MSPETLWCTSELCFLGTLSHLTSSFCCMIADKEDEECWLFLFYFSFFILLRLNLSMQRMFLFHLIFLDVSSFLPTLRKLLVSKLVLFLCLSCCVQVGSCCKLPTVVMNIRALRFPHTWTVCPHYTYLSHQKRLLLTVKRVFFSPLIYVRDWGEAADLWSTSRSLHAFKASGAVA